MPDDEEKEEEDNELYEDEDMNADGEDLSMPGPCLSSFKVNALNCLSACLSKSVQEKSAPRSVK